MRKIWNYLLDMQCIDQVTGLTMFITYLFLAACYVLISNNNSLVLRDNHTNSENISLIWRSVSAGQKTCNLKGVLVRGL